ncbi:NAD-dependent epimerase/dehydratase family protein [Microbacterium phyllosphaerae]
MSEATPGGVLVTGGAGFIGSALSRLSVSPNARWVAVDTLNPRIHESQERPPALHPSAELITGDIVDPATWDHVLADWSPDVVVHLAAETDTGLSLDHPVRFSTVNVDGTAQLMQALRRHNVTPRRIVVASSRAVYGEGVWRDAATGDERTRSQRTHSELLAGQWDFPGASPVAARAGLTPTNTSNVYATTKLAQEGLLSAWCSSHGVDLSILRLQNVYGPGQSLINPYTGILALFVRLAAEGKAIPVYEDGAMLRDFVHIDDVARAFATVISEDYAEHGTTMYDIGTGAPASVFEVAEAIASELGAPTPVVTGNFREGDVRHAWCEVADAVSRLEWSPQIDWRTGISAYVNWYLERNGAQR